MTWRFFVALPVRIGQALRAFIVTGTPRIRRRNLLKGL
jgi:hypothetical protein